MPVRLQDESDAARLLQEGGVLVLPTDTLPGLHARADRPQSVQRVADLKGRQGSKPLLLLAADLDMALALTRDMSPRQQVYAASCWPGPFSLVLPAAPGLPAEVTGGGQTVAVRVPRPVGLRGLLQAVGCPLVSTSVNPAGEAPAADLETAGRAFSDGVDGVYDPGDPEPAVPATASALIDLTRWPPRLLREGPEAPPRVPDGLDPEDGAS